MLITVAIIQKKVVDESAGSTTVGLRAGQHIRIEYSTISGAKCFIFTGRM